MADQAAELGPTALRQLTEPPYRGLLVVENPATSSPGLAFLAATIAVGLYAAHALGLNTNENDLFSEDLPYHALRDDFNASFPTLVDPIIVVVDGATVDVAHDAAETLARRIASESERFGRVHRPEGGPFFETQACEY